MLVGVCRWLFEVEIRPALEKLLRCAGMQKLSQSIEAIPVGLFVEK
jgi:hypothetical protein